MRKKVKENWVECNNTVYVLIGIVIYSSERGHLVGGLYVT